jgi:hypothetical protein
VPLSEWISSPYKPQPKPCEICGSPDIPKDVDYGPGPGPLVLVPKPVLPPLPPMPGSSTGGARYGLAPHFGSGPWYMTDTQTGLYVRPFRTEAEARAAVDQANASG